MKTNKPCRKCDNQHLDFNEEARGRELTCKKCGAVYEYRAYMASTSSQDSMWGKTADALAKIKQEETMSKKGNCDVCGRKNTWIISAGKCAKCYKASRKEGNDRQDQGPDKPVAGNMAVAGIMNPDGVVIPVRLEITVSLKVETK